MFYVIGGKYIDPQFTRSAEKREQRFGPFPTWQKAYETWATLSWEKVDDCMIRYRIERIGDSGLGEPEPQRRS